VLFPERVPSVLQAIPQWVVWRAELRDGKLTKVPHREDLASALAKLKVVRSQETGLA
jgi:hypothetical protein